MAQIPILTSLLQPGDLANKQPSELTGQPGTIDAAEAGGVPDPFGIGSVEGGLDQLERLQTPSPAEQQQLRRIDDLLISYRNRLQALDELPEGQPTMMQRIFGGRAFRGGQRLRRELIRLEGAKTIVPAINELLKERRQLTEPTQIETALAKEIIDTMGAIDTRARMLRVFDQIERMDPGMLNNPEYIAHKANSLMLGNEIQLPDIKEPTVQDMRAAQESAIAMEAFDNPEDVVRALRQADIPDKFLPAALAAWATTKHFNDLKREQKLTEDAPWWGPYKTPKEAYDQVQRHLDNLLTDGTIPVVPQYVQIPDPMDPRRTTTRIINRLAWPIERQIRHILTNIMHMPAEQQRQLYGDLIDESEPPPGIALPGRDTSGGSFLPAQAGEQLRESALRRKLDARRQEAQSAEQAAAGNNE